MIDDATEQSLREIFATVLEIPLDEVVPSLSPDSCANWDSLRHIHLVSAIEETFGVKLTVEQQLEIMNFDLAVEVVRETV